MSVASNPPMPNPRQCNGFLVTLGLPALVAAARLLPGDVFVLPENSGEQLKIEAITPHPKISTHLTITFVDERAQLTLREDEPVRPVCMPRTIQVTCQLCGTAATTDLDLVAQGEPKTWVCNQH